MAAAQEAGRSLGTGDGRLRRRQRLAGQRGREPAWSRRGARAARTACDCARVRPRPHQGSEGAISAEAGASTGHARVGAANGGNLGHRAQVRWLSRDGQDRRGQGSVDHPQRPRLDRQVDVACAGDGGDRHRNGLAGWRDGGHERSRRAGLQPAAERLRQLAHRGHRAVPVRRAVPRRHGSAPSAAAQPAQRVAGASESEFVRSHPVQRRAAVHLCFGRAQRRLRAGAGRGDAQGRGLCLHVAPKRGLAEAQMPTAPGIRCRGFHGPRQRRERSWGPAARLLRWRRQVALGWVGGHRLVFGSGSTAVRRAGPP